MVRGMGLSVVLAHLGYLLQSIVARKDTGRRERATQRNAYDSLMVSADASLNRHGSSDSVRQGSLDRRMKKRAECGTQQMGRYYV